MLSDKNWKLEAVLKCALSIFLCVCVGSFLTALVSSHHNAATKPSIWQTVLTLLCFQCATLVFVWRLVREHETSWSNLFGFRNDQKKAIWQGVLTAILFLPVGMGFKWLIAVSLDHFHIETPDQKIVEILASASLSERLALGITAVLLAPIAEEFIFRGILYPAIKHAGFPRLAFWGTAALFAVIHGNLVALLPLMLLALVLTWLYEQSDNLLATITAHATFNAINFGMFLLTENFYRNLPKPA